MSELAHLRIQQEVMMFLTCDGRKTEKDKYLKMKRRHRKHRQRRQLGKTTGFQSFWQRPNAIVDVLSAKTHDLS